MIRHGDLSARTARMAQRIREVGAVLPAERVRPTQGEDPLGLGLSYPLMFMAYDTETGIETPLSGLIHEDDPNVVVVSLVAEAIAEEGETARWWSCEGCHSVTSDPSDAEVWSTCGEVSTHRWQQSPVTEFVYVMEVWS